MYLAKFTSGKFIFKDSTKREKLMKLSEKPDGIMVEIKPLTPESRQQRKFLHGAVYPLWLYLDEKDHHDHELLGDIHEFAKRSFNPKIIVFAGRTQVIGETTKGKLNDGFIEKIIDFLEEQYGIDRTKVLDPASFKFFLDKVFPTGEYEDYIDFLVKLGLLPARQMKL